MKFKHGDRIIYIGSIIETFHNQVGTIWDYRYARLARITPVFYFEHELKSGKKFFVLFDNKDIRGSFKLLPICVYNIELIKYYEI